jgi:nucleoside phosphorylase
MKDKIKFEIVVLCAKSDEQNFVTQYFSKVFDRVDHFRPVFKTAAKQGSPANILVMNCGEMGNIGSACITGHICGSYNPGLAILVGTAGSLNPLKYNIGDVVIPELGAISHGYDGILDSAHSDFIKFRDDRNKIGILPTGTDGTTYAFRPDTNKSNIPLSRYSRDVISKARENTAGIAELSSMLEKYDGNTAPKVHNDVHVFSWEKIVYSAKYRDNLQSQFSKTAIVDMESYGFLKAAKQYQDDTALRAIVVRGISDLCGDKAIEFHDGFAVKNAAIVAAEIIKRGYMVL